MSSRAAARTSRAVITDNPLSTRQRVKQPDTMAAIVSPGPEQLQNFIPPKSRIIEQPTGHRC
jgi:hypothetical protein